MDLRTNDRIQLQGYTRAEVTKVDTSTWIELQLPGGQTIQVVNYRIATFSDWQLLFS